MDTKPNIILVNADDLGFGDLGCYGSKANDTPHLDKLASEGCCLTSFYMASPVCSPSRGAMLTGCYPPRIGFGSFGGKPVLFPGDETGLSTDELTLPRMLKDEGYATAMVGKWHCGDQPEFLPTRHGFDHYYGIPYSNDMGRQFEDDFNPPLPLMRDEAVVQEQPDQTCLTERYVEESIRFMRANQDRPFFLYLAHLHVHVPHYVSQNFLKRSRNGAYGAAVSAIDWAMGALTFELKRLGLEENTLVIFTSDNGSRVRGEGGSNGSLRGIKGETWEGGQRVPCILKWPGRIPAGSSSGALLSAMEFLPTFAEILGHALPRERRIDGYSLADFLKDPEASKSPRESFYYYLKDGLEAVRDSRWKLHLAKGTSPHEDSFETVEELYDLHADPGETRNCIEEHPETAAQLKKMAEATRKDLGDFYTETPKGPDCRPVGRVDNARPLTELDLNHPYVISVYDLKDRG